MYIYAYYMNRYFNSKNPLIFMGIFIILSCNTNYKLKAKNVEEMEVIAKHA